MNTYDILRLAASYLDGLIGHEFDVIEVKKPVSPESAVSLTKVISKLSPMVGNLIEFNTCEYLNDQIGFPSHGKWIRQDPGFPDTIFDSDIHPVPGFEIKAWFPLSTEITARFKDSQNHFIYDQTYVVLLAWLPEFLIFGKPSIIDIVIVSGASVAKARDDHYSNPPDYLVLEPGDTTQRTVNLQQTNTNGYKFQGTPQQFREAQNIVSRWGNSARFYEPNFEYQQMLRTLIERFPYRLDTNFAKIDRICHPEIENFKRRVHGTIFHGKTIGEWQRILSRGNDEYIRYELERHFDIRDVGRSVID